MLRSILGWAGISGASWVFPYAMLRSLGPLGFFSWWDCGFWELWGVSLLQDGASGASGYRCLFHRDNSGQLPGSECWIAFCRVGPGSPRPLGSLSGPIQGLQGLWVLSFRLGSLGSLELLENRCLFHRKDTGQPLEVGHCRLESLRHMRSLCVLACDLWDL